MSRDDFNFANDIRAAKDRDIPWFVFGLLSVIVLMFVTLGFWANFAVLDEVSTASGQVTPASRVQVIQSLEGGLVRSIEVSEGEIVKQNQILLKIDDVNFSSQLGELTKRQTSSRIKIVRLQAEANQENSLVFPKELARLAPDSVEAEKALFVARQEQLQSQIDIFSSQLVQANLELSELNARRSKISSGLVFTNKELALSRKLLKQRAIPEIEFLKLERQAADAKGELAIVEASLERVTASKVEIENRKLSARAKFQTESRAELANVIGQLAVVNEALAGAKDKVKRTTIRSPVRGVVNTLSVTTVGGVLQPGEKIMEIVPMDDSLLVEAQVKPQDIAFIRPGQPASVKLTAYDYTVYGTLSGKVEQVSATTITNANGDVFYRVIVRTDKTSVERDNKQSPIIPGMIASVDILTGQKSVLQYLVQPVKKMSAEALRER